MINLDRVSTKFPTNDEKAAGTGPAQLLGLRRSAWVEIGLFISVAFVLDLTVFLGERFWDATPHPFWILVVLISAQYGTAEGLLAALVASVALLAGNLPTQTIDQDLYAYAFEITWRPLMWAVTAVFIGEISNRHLNARDSLVDEVRKATESEERISLAYTTTKAAKEKLAGRVAGQVRTVLTTLRALKNVEKFKPGEVLLGTLDLVDQTLGPKKFSLFILNNNVLEAMAHRGWEEGDAFSSAIRPTSPLFQAVVGEQRVLCAADAVEEALLDGEGLLAGPLVYPETGEVVGMLKLEDLDFYELNVVTIENFRGLCDWVGAALAHASEFETVSALNPMAVGDLYSEWYFDRHIAFLTSLARRVGFPITLMKLELENPKKLSKDELQAVPHALHHAATEHLRETDLCFEQGEDKHGYTIVLAGTAHSGAQIVVDKLLPALNTELAEEGSKAQFTVSLNEMEVEGRGNVQRTGNTFGQLDQQISFMTGLAEEFHFGLNLLSLRMDGFDKLDTERAAEARSVFESSLGMAVQFMPLASCHPHPHSESTFAVLLPTQVEREAQEAADKLVSASNNALTAAGFEPGIQADVRDLVQGTSSSKSDQVASLAARWAS